MRQMRLRSARFAREACLTPRILDLLRLHAWPGLTPVAPGGPQSRRYMAWTVVHAEPRYRIHRLTESYLRPI